MSLSFAIVIFRRPQGIKLRCFRLQLQRGFAYAFYAATVPLSTSRISYDEETYSQFSKVLVAR